MNTRKWCASLALAVLYCVLPVSAHAQQDGVAQRVAALEAMVAALQGQVAALQTASATMQAQITALQAANQALVTADTDLLNHINSEVAARQAADAGLEAQFVGGGIPGLNSYVSVDPDTHTVLFTGANVQIVNGMGSTETLNGRGNLIIGYNTARVYADGLICSDGQYGDQSSCEAAGQVWAMSHKSGSHNIVGGERNSYSSYGGLIMGEFGVINAAFATITAGEGNTASGVQSSVSGGADNVASGPQSIVVGGDANKAIADSSGIFGGVQNITVDAGTGYVFGGRVNVSYSGEIFGGTGNVANGFGSVVLGGYANVAGGQYTSVSGGHGCTETRLHGWSVGNTEDRTGGCAISNTP